MENDISRHGYGIIEVPDPHGIIRDLTVSNLNWQKKADALDARIQELEGREEAHDRIIEGWKQFEVECNRKDWRIEELEAVVEAARFLLECEEDEVRYSRLSAALARLDGEGT